VNVPTSFSTFYLRTLFSARTFSLQPKCVPSAEHNCIFRASIFADIQ
jgi:hypothetical protein